MLHCYDALKIVGTICHRMERKKQTTLPVHRTFWYISKCPPCNYDVKFPTKRRFIADVDNDCTHCKEQFQIIENSFIIHVFLAIDVVLFIRVYEKIHHFHTDHNAA